VSDLGEDEGDRVRAAYGTNYVHPGCHGSAAGRPVVKGRENIKHMWASTISQMGLRDMRLDSIDLEIAGDAASEVGAATLSFEAEPGKRQTAVVKFVVVWKKVDGQWRLHRDIWNAQGA
jgi:ketosteroid isomerase-like protein